MIYLQAASCSRFHYQTLSERLIFFFFSLWFDLSFVGLLASVWFFVADKLNKYGLAILLYFYRYIVVFVRYLASV